MKKTTVLAIDLGASSGRGILGSFDGSRLELEEINRFSNDPLEIGGKLCWNSEKLRSDVEESVRRGDAAGAVSVGIDTWGVDYVLLDSDRKLISPPVHYRDERTEGIQEYFGRFMPWEELYGITGIQSMNFNTVYQLTAENRDCPGKLDSADRLLFMPDWLNFCISGKEATEYTICSTGALIDAKARKLSEKVLKNAGIPSKIFASPVFPGNILGTVKPEFGGKMKVINVAEHDTGSAVLAVPTSEKSGEFLYISSGTWSLMGTELDAPFMDEKCRIANYTNEGGAFGTVRFLKNIMGLWLLQESRRQWAREGKQLSFDDLSNASAAAPAFASLINPNDMFFNAPGDMPGRIAEYCRLTGQRVPENPGETVRVIFDSLAMCYRDTAETISGLTGFSPKAINIVGGGSKDVELNQRTADVTGLPVIAGPGEATAVGNIIMQLIALGEIKDLKEGRKIVADSFGAKHFAPDPDRSIYDEAYARYKKIIGNILKPM